MGTQDTEEDRPSNRDVPKLTLGQRILTALPSLDRQQPKPRGIEPDAVISPSEKASRPLSGSGRLRDSFLKPPPGGTAKKADPTAEMSNEELAQGIKRIDDRERVYALYAGPLGAIVGIVLTVLAIHYNPPLHHKNHVAENIIVLEGVARIVLGGLVVVAAFSRRRSLVAFALLFLGTAMGNPLFAVLWWGLGGWMIWRVFRYQKALTARGVGPQRGQRARASQGPRVAARSGATDARTLARERKQARARKKNKEPVPTGPPPSKRYTPPKPPRPSSS